MAIRTVGDPLGGFPGIVDARIGTAFATVEIVAVNIDAVKTVADNIDAILNSTFHAAEMSLLEGSAQVTAVALGVNVPMTVPLPEVMAGRKVLGFSVYIQALNGDMYLPGPEFSARIIGGALTVVVLPVGAVLVGGMIHWHITYAP
jgi:hypothetical protein